MTEIPPEALEVLEAHCTKDADFFAQALGESAAQARINAGHKSLLESLQESIDEHDIAGALGLVSSELRLSMCRALWSLVPKSEHAETLALAISSGDNPGREHFWLHETLCELLDQGRRIFDCDAARETFEALPETVTVYRGTVQAEVEYTESEFEPFGICWTLSRETASWFATKHGRFRNRQSSPVIVSATVHRDEIYGLLTERNESEALVCVEVADHVEAL